MFFKFSTIATMSNSKISLTSIKRNIYPCLYSTVCFQERKTNPCVLWPIVLISIKCTFQTYGSTNKLKMGIYLQRGKVLNI